ncbi:MAG: hypothetical protein ABIW38_02445 [Ferruginibacter sp.]
MDKLLTAYLLYHKHCPLPGLGSMHLQQQPARVIAADGIISAPKNDISFSPKEIPSNELLEFIAHKKNISTQEASGMLGDYCRRLQDMDAYNEMELSPTGKFYVDAEGNLQFKTASPDNAFLPDVPAVRVIHPQQSHSMLVGDTQTDTAAMTAFYTDDEEVSKSRWWIWPVLIFITAALIFIFYISAGLHNPLYGNAQAIEKTSAEKTYRSIP